ncbi:aldehyde dehydrogenase family protein, partial [Pandoraea sputorum]|uniref:aldehyde dehydrogenase family protein n=1 Tax=Pandoraea sputorum TaxID=93222 RepID=UPI002F9140B5
RDHAGSSRCDASTALSAGIMGYDCTMLRTASACARVMMKYRELLETNREALVQLITQEHGKTLDDARGEVTRGIEVVEFAIGIPHLLKGEIAPQVGTGVDTYSIHQPVGVCAGITPVNFPAKVPLWMFPMAVA